jgi:hypothetical protein
MSQHWPRKQQDFSEEIYDVYKFTFKVPMAGRKSLRFKKEKRKKKKNSVFHLSPFLLATSSKTLELPNGTLTLIQISFKSELVLLKLKFDILTSIC